MITGIIAGFLSALFQASSYLCGTMFMKKYRSTMRLIIFSQLAMGIGSLPFLPWAIPSDLAGKHWEFIGTIFLWMLVFAVGQCTFFYALKSIEASRMSSLLGLKIVVLSFISILFLGKTLTLIQWFAIILSASSAILMNWSGGNKFSIKGLIALFLTLIFYSFADMTETKLVLMPQNTNIISAALQVAVLCYVLLGLCSIPFLWKFRWSNRQFKLSIPFAFTWFFSQVALFVCFGLIGPIFGNIIQSGRGLVSVGLGLLLAYMNLSKFDAKISKKMWQRRVIAAIMMTISIILFAIFANK